MYNGHKSQISTRQLERQVAQLRELESKISAVGRDTWAEIEALKLERFKMGLQIKAALAVGYDPQQLYNEVGIIDEMIDELENGRDNNDNGVGPYHINSDTPASADGDEIIF